MTRLQDMPGGGAAPGSGGVAAAIEHVLAAERAASAEIERSRARAAARVAEARLEARRILERAESVCQAIHARTERIAARRAADLVRAAAPRDADPAELDAIVARVAALLTDPDDD